MKTIIISIFFLFSLTVVGQKGVGLSGRVVNEINESPVPNKKVFIVFDSSAINSVASLHNQLITAPDGSFLLSAPDIPDSIIPLEVMVYTFDCNFQRHGYLLTFNENDIMATDIEIDVCAGLVPPLPNAIVANHPDNNCPTFTLLRANDSLKRNHLYEQFSWRNDEVDLGSGNNISALLNQTSNNISLQTTYVDSITGFVYDSVLNFKNFVYSESLFHLFGGNVLFDGIPTETGRAVLLYNANNQYFIEDTMDFNQYGYYYFNEAPTCRYSARIIGTDDSIASTVIPTYLGNVVHWTSASFIQVNDDYFLGNINLIAGQSLNGLCEIHGQMQASPASGYDIILYSSTMQPIASVSADESGLFSITQIPYGDYYIYSEKYGVLSLIGFASLTPGNPVENIILNNATFIGENTEAVIAVYPNPASDFINITAPDHAVINILTADGRVIRELESNANTISVGDLAQGLYFVQVIADGQTSCVKFMVSR